MARSAGQAATGDRAIEPDFDQIAKEAGGMLRAEVYEAIFRRASESDEGDFVEVGTGHGAATICLALAARRLGRRVYTFEKAEGGSRAAFGGVAENLAIIRRNLRRFGVEDLVQVVVGDVGVTAPAALPARAPLGLLFLDADGAIDRDLSLFYDRLEPGASVIVDDYADRAFIRRMGAGRYRVGLKHKLTFDLVNIFLEQGLLEEEAVLRSTFFGRRPHTLSREVDFRAVDCLPAYRALVLAEAELPGRVRERVRTWLGKHPPLERLVLALKSEAAIRAKRAP